MPKKKKKLTVKSPLSVFGKIRIALCIALFAALMLFYPGNSYYVDLFAYSPKMFAPSQNITRTYETHPMPYVSKDAPAPIVSADGAYILELQSATPVFERNIHKRLFPASTTKVVSALTAADHYKLDDVLTVKRFLNEGQSVDLVVGERLTFESILYGMLVHSGNDAAYVVADNYPGGFDAFITAMNQKAKDVDMRDSQFKNPAGLDATNQYSSAYDLSLAARELLKNPVLKKIVSTKSITISDVDFTHFHALYNVNELLGKIPGIEGLKTGKTDLAGENLITLYKKNGKEYLIVLLKSSDRFADTENLVNWLNTSVHFQEL